MSQSLSGAYDGLLAVLQGLFPDTVNTVVEGDVESLQADLVVQLLPLPIPIVRPTMAPSRSRELEAQVLVLISAFTPGGAEATTTSRQTAMAAAELLQAYLRVQGNETLGSTVRDSWVSLFTPDQYILWAEGEDGPPQVPFGRVFEISCTVELRIRL